MSNVSAIIEENEAQLGFGREVVYNELLGGSSQEVPNVVVVHGCRILQYYDVSGRFLTADNKLRNN